jgi:heme-degrading monooxygenase HmoA
VAVTAYVIVWRYEVPTSSRDAFEAAYGPTGPWAALFGRTPGYLGTELVRLDDGAYVTLDRWLTEDAFQRFLADHRADYDALDQELEPLTSAEVRIGAGELV